MAFHNNGRKFYHLVRCHDRLHFYITDGMLFNLEEIKCKKHFQWMLVLKYNLTKNDAEAMKLNGETN